MESLHIAEMIGDNLTVDPNRTSNTTVTPNPHPNGFQLFIIWIIPVLIVLLNTVVFIIVPRIKTLQPGTRIGMLSLAASDFCMGTFLIVNHIYISGFAHYETDKSQPFCVLVGIAISISFGTSMMALAFLGIDRLIKMVVPLYYPRIMTTRNTRIIFAIIWTLIIVQMLMNFRDTSAIQSHYYEHVFVCINGWVGDSVYNLSFAFFTQVLPTFTCMASFIGIFCIATRRKMRPREDSSAQFKRDLRIFKTLAIMTLGEFCMRIFQHIHYTHLQYLL